MYPYACKVSYFLVIAMRIILLRVTQHTSCRFSKMNSSDLDPKILAEIISANPNFLQLYRQVEKAVEKESCRDKNVPSPGKYCMKITHFLDNTLLILLTRWC